MIKKFEGAYRFLSNFWPSVVNFDGQQYQSVEHAFQAAKTTNLKEREFIRSQPTPGKAKQAGRSVTLRSDWEKIKIDVMRNLLIEKFNQYPLKQLLLSTGDEELVEGNNWGDVFWGVCNGAGENHLGKLLMKIRNILKEKSL